MRRVLVTGATGFIGRHALQPLRERGYEVHAVTSSPERASSADGVRMHVADLLSSDDTARLIDEVRPSHLVHLAWYVSPGRFWTAAENGEWVEASLRLLRLFGAAGGERAVLAGSCAEYDWRYAISSEQDTPLAPATLYGTCKAALSSMALRLAEETGVSTAWGRIFFVYGPAEYPTRLLASVIRALLAGERAPTSHGGQVRDYLYSVDYGDAFAALLDSDVRGAVNIGSGEPLTLRELIMRTAELIGREQLVDLGAIASAPDEAAAVVASVRRLRDEVGWQPRHTLDEGLERTIAWWREDRRFERAARG